MRSLDSTNTTNTDDIDEKDTDQKLKKYHYLYKT